MPYNRFGFSTGALEKGNFRAALNWIEQHQLRCVELSALRYEELQPIVDSINDIPVDRFQYVSFHAPSSFTPDQERRVIDGLDRIARRGWNIVVHPDVIYSPALWEHFGDRLLVENMDRRKSTGRSVDEIRDILLRLPRARLCLDLAHARQLDTTLTLLCSLATVFAGRIAEIHISDLDSRCRHRMMSWQSIIDYKQFAPMLRHIPVIIESVLYKHDTASREQELQFAYDALESDAD